MDNMTLQEHAEHVERTSRMIQGAAQRLLRSIRRGDADVQERMQKMHDECYILNTFMKEMQDAKDAGAAEAEADA